LRKPYRAIQMQLSDRYCKIPETDVDRKQLTETRKVSQLKDKLIHKNKIKNMEKQSKEKTRHRYVYIVFSDTESSARIYGPSFRENKPKTLVFSHRKRAFWADFRENWVYKFGERQPV
jgi:hypothetical protein